MEPRACALTNDAKGCIMIANLCTLWSEIHMIFFGSKDQSAHITPYELQECRTLMSTLLKSSNKKYNEPDCVILMWVKMNYTQRRFNTVDLTKVHCIQKFRGDPLTKTDKKGQPVDEERACYRLVDPTTGTYEKVESHEKVADGVEKQQVEQQEEFEDARCTYG